MALRLIWSVLCAPITHSSAGSVGPGLGFTVSMTGPVVNKCLTTPIWAFIVVGVIAFLVLYVQRGRATVCVGRAAS